jgi:hypothetical protein
LRENSLTKYKIGNWLRVEPGSFDHMQVGDNIIQIIDMKKEGEDTKFKLRFYYDWEEKKLLFDSPVEDWWYEEEMIYESYTPREFLKSVFEYPIKVK